MIKYVHIGYPKNFSTSLQRSFFSINPEIYHLGIGNDSNIDYKDKFLSSIFEVYLKTSKGFKYNEVKKRIKDHIDFHYSKAIESKAKAFGVSSEHFSFSFTYDCLDFETKFDRLIELFGDDIVVIAIIREQIALIKSLYKESVRVGFPGSFNDFLYAFYKYQDRNYYYDLRYDLVYDYLSKKLSANQLHLLTFESYRGEREKLLKNDMGEYSITSDLAKILKVKNKGDVFQHFNAALKDKEVKIKSELNKTTRHDLGNNLYSSAELHRQAQYFIQELELNEKENILFRDVLVKRKLLKDAASMAEDNNVDFDLFKCDKELLNKISTFYMKGNQKLIDLSGIKLTDEYLIESF